MGGNSDLERRIMRLEQALPGLRQRIVKLKELNGRLIEVFSGGGTRTSNDGASQGAYFDGTCGIWIPDTLTLSSSLYSGGTNTLTWDSGAGQWLGAFYINQCCVRSIDCVNIGDPGNNDCAVVFQLTPGTTYTLTIQNKYCVGGGQNGVTTAAAIPGTLSGSNLFGVGSTRTDTKTGLTFNCTTHQMSYAAETINGCGIGGGISF